MTALSAARTQANDARVNVPCPTCARDRWVCAYPSTITNTARKECRECGIRTRTNSRRRTYRERENILDEVVIERLCNGRPVPYATYEERRAAMLTMINRGLPADEIANRAGVSERTVDRWKAKRVAA